MAVDPKLIQENARLRELWSYDIVDTEPDPRLDQIVRLAAEICRSPIAAISLVDSERLWFKSKFGFSSMDMAREKSFCGAVVDAAAPLIIDRAANDSRFRDNSLVCGPLHVGAYIGFPLLSPSGQCLGSLCVLDDKAHTWSALECRAVEVLAAQVIAHLELRRSNAELLRVWEDLREVETRTLTGRQDDQRRIAAELHDGLGQDLTGMSLLLRAVRGQTTETAVREELQKIEQLMRGAIDTCRRLAREQTAFGFVHGSLRESLQHFLDGVNEISNVNCELRWPDRVVLQDRAVEYNLYRIAQEAVTNAVRHSGAKQIQVRAEMHGDILRLDIEDDGTGLREGTMSEGVGLETMRYRANTIGGRLELSPRPPSGLLVRCELQLAKGALSAPGNRRRRR